MPNRLPGLLASVAPALVVLLLAIAARHLLIEPSAIAFGCEPTPWQGHCAVRSLVLRTFVHQEIGWVALAAGVAAFLLRARWLAAFALACGCAGLVLYSYEPAAIGALLGLLVIARGHAQTASTPISAA